MPSTLWKEQKGRLLTEIAMSVRMAAGGQMEMYDDFGSDYYILHKAVRDWKPSFTKWTEKVDNAVYVLITSALDEASRNNSFWIKDELERYWRNKNGLQKNLKPK